MKWSEQEPTTNPGRRSIEERHGMMMRDVAELGARVERLERLVFQASMRPRVKTAGLTTAVAGAVVGALELLRYLEIFR